MRSLVEPTQHESELVRKARQGDKGAFSALVKRYESTVYGFAFKVCRNQEQAAETLQDTFVNVYRKLDQFDGRAKFSTWLYQIVTNNCLMKRRKRKIEEAALSLDAAEGEKVGADPEGAVPHQALASFKTTPQDEFVNKELRELLDEAILRLPMDQRIVFVLRDVEGRSSEEAAKILKLSVPAVKSRLRRARVFLREQLREYVET